MSYSLWELEALGKKAARGAGFSWGEAEEAGQALRILAASGLPAAALFARYLQAGRAEDAACPIKLGCALVDGANPELSGCAEPDLLMPFVARLAAQTHSALLLSGEGYRASAGPDLAVTVEASTPSPRALTIKATQQAPKVARVFRAQAEQNDIDTLDLFAQQTYAPETEARRAAGAGDEANT